MDIQRIFDALVEDQDNSALGIICRELEAKGYGIEIDGKTVSSEGFFNGEFTELEDRIGPFNISLMIKGNIEQRFCIEFVEYHEIIIRKAD